MTDINREMTKEEFMLQYVLNRALISSNLSGAGAAEEAAKAYKKIKELSDEVI